MAMPVRFALLATLAVATSLAAQEPGLSAGGAQKSYSLFDLVIGSGWVEWTLLLMSVVGFALAIQFALTITRPRLITEGLVDDVHNVLQDGVTEESVDEALNLVASDHSIVGECLAGALDKKDFGYDAMKDAAQTVAAAEQNKYMAKLGWLSLLTAQGPMWGLLGTVWGMIGAFLVMAQKGTVTPADLAYDIGGAMITTATGLIIALPLMVIFFWLRGRVNQAVLDAEVMVMEVLDYFRSK